jgi:hypothetical protein
MLKLRRDDIWSVINALAISHTAGPIICPVPAVWQVHIVVYDVILRGIHSHVRYLVHSFPETAFCLLLQIVPTQIWHIHKLVPVSGTL